MTAAVLVCAAGSVFAQGTTTAQSNAPAQKAIGVPTTVTAAKVEPSLFVMNATGATLVNNKLILTGVAPSAIIFADRPTRAAGRALAAHLFEEWGGAAEASFEKDPLNATV
jgi:hypothetical protein